MDPPPPSTQRVYQRQGVAGIRCESIGPDFAPQFGIGAKPRAANDDSDVALTELLVDGFDEPDQSRHVREHRDRNTSHTRLMLFDYAQNSGMRHIGAQESHVPAICFEYVGYDVGTDMMVLSLYPGTTMFPFIVAGRSALGYSCAITYWVMAVAMCSCATVMAFVSQSRPISNWAVCSRST